MSGTAIRPLAAMTDGVAAPLILRTLTGVARSATERGATDTGA